jgi:TM2 domain-containing membrane protein YozV
MTGTAQASAAVRLSDKKRLIAALLCFFLGFLGAHRFYVGKMGTAVLMILTLGGLGLWALFDLVIILIGAFTDADGGRLEEWL